MSRDLAPGEWDLRSAIFRPDHTFLLPRTYPAMTSSLVSLFRDIHGVSLVGRVYSSVTKYQGEQLRSVIVNQAQDRKKARAFVGPTWLH